MNWEVAASIRRILVGPEVLVADFRCPGERRGWTREATSHFVLELPRRGAHLRAIGRERVLADPTIAALSFPGDELSIASPSAAPQESTLVGLAGTVAEELAPGGSPRIVRLSPGTALLHQRLVTTKDPVAVEEGAVLLAARVLEDARGVASRAEARPSASHRRLAEEMQHLIATRHHEGLTLANITSACGASTFHGSRVFRAVVGETVHRHLRRVRLRAALFDLAAANGRLSELALRAGFSSHSHFTAAFQSEFACLPSDVAALDRAWLRLRPR